MRPESQVENLPNNYSGDIMDDFIVTLESQEWHMIGSQVPSFDEGEDRKGEAPTFPPVHPTQARTAGVTRPAPFCPTAPVFFRPLVPAEPAPIVSLPLVPRSLRPSEPITTGSTADPSADQSPAPAPASANGKPAIRGRPFANVARAATVARKEADLAAKAATEARILGVDEAPAAVLRYADEATRCAELAEIAAVAAEGFKQESVNGADPQRDAEFRNKGTVVARQAMEWREKTSRALRSAAEAAGVTLRQRAPGRKGVKRKQREPESSSGEDEAEDVRNLQLLAEAGSLETGSMANDGASGGDSQGGPRALDEAFFPSESGSHESGGNAMVSEEGVHVQKMHRAQHAQQDRKMVRSIHALAKQPSGGVSQGVDVLAAAVAGPGDWTVAHELLWNAVLQHFDGSDLPPEQEMVVLSRLVLDDMTSFEAVACIRSIQALETVKTPGAASMYLRHRVLAASGQKGYKSNYEI